MATIFSIFSETFNFSNGFFADDRIFKNVKATPSKGASIYRKYARWGKPPLTYYVGQEAEVLTISGLYYTEKTKGRSPFIKLYTVKSTGEIITLAWAYTPVPFIPPERSRTPSHIEKYVIQNLIEIPDELFQQIPIKSEFILTLERVYD